MNDVQKYFSQRTQWDDGKEESLNLIKEKEPHRAFPNEIWEMLTVDSVDFNNRKVLVPSSGDNFAAFAFCLLGASVTSTDFMQNVLDEAEKRANEHSLSNIAFKNVDTMTLADLPDNEYDFIFTSNGVYNCLHDLLGTYRSFFRVLKPNGMFCFYENHPFYSIISEEIDTTASEYKGTGQLIYEIEKDKTIIEPDSIKNFHTMEDYISSLVNAGFRITHYRNIKRCEDALSYLRYKSNINYIAKPSLPAWIGISAMKK